VPHRGHDPDDRSVRKDDGAVDGILELAHVSRPGMAFEEARVAGSNVAPSRP
jgi:hypothetical protein